MNRIAFAAAVITPGVLYASLVPLSQSRFIEVPVTNTSIVANDFESFIASYTSPGGTHAAQSSHINASGVVATMTANPGFEDFAGGGGFSAARSQSRFSLTFSIDQPHAFDLEMSSVGGALFTQYRVEIVGVVSGSAYPGYVEYPPEAFFATGVLQPGTYTLNSWVSQAGRFDWSFGGTGQMAMTLTPIPGPTGLALAMIAVASVRVRRRRSI